VPPEACPGDKQHFFRLAEADAFSENSEIERLDAREKRVVGVDEQPQRAAAVRIDQIEQFRAFLVGLEGPVGFKAQQLADAERAFFFQKVGRRNAKSREVFLGNIDAAECRVFVHVADDVGELERQAQLFREIQCARVPETENMRAGEADRAGHSITVFAQPVESGIGPDGEVHFGAGDQVVQVARGHAEAAHGVGQRRQDFGGPPRRRFEAQGRAAVEKRAITADGFIECGAPFGQAALLRGNVQALVGDIVNQAHESVQSGQAVAFGFGQQKNA